ncbi:MAG: AsmA family protein [Alphaproteobacteria bacterium]|nr:AsmA family protein [Alphaproteobacteria bacterium]
MTGWRKLVPIVFVLLMAAGGVAAVFALKTLDLNTFKSDVVRLARGAIGREIEIAGDIHLDLSLTPYLSLENVTLANAAWGSKPVMLRLDRVEARVALVPLLSRRVEVSSITAHGLRLLLETSADGKDNWVLETPGRVSEMSGSVDLVPDVRDVQLRDVNLTYIDGASGQVVDVAFDRVDLRTDGVDSPLTGELAGGIGGEPFTARVQTGSAAQFLGLDPSAVPLRVDLDSLDMKAGFVGKVSNPADGFGASGDLRVQAPDAQVLARMMGIDLPPVGALDLSAAIAGDARAISLDGIDLTAGNSDAAGGILLELSGSRPTVSGWLVSTKLDANAFLPPPGEGGGERLFDREPLTLDILREVDADVHWSIGRLDVRDVIVADVSAHVALADGGLELDPIGATVLGAPVGGRLALDEGGIDASLRMAAMEADRIATLAGHGGKVDVALDGAVNVSARGRSLHDWAVSLDGYLSLSGRNGRVLDPEIRGMVGETLQCVRAEWPVENGIATADGVILNTDGVEIVVRGTVDLGGETVSLLVDTQAKKTSLASFAVPVNVTGPLLKPEIEVKTGEAVLGTVGNIVKAPAIVLLGALKGTVEALGGDAAIPDPCAATYARIQAAKTQKKETEPAR